MSQKSTDSHKCRVFTLPGDVQNYVQNFLGVRQGSVRGSVLGVRLEFCTEFRTGTSVGFLPFLVRWVQGAKGVQKLASGDREYL